MEYWEPMTKTQWTIKARVLVESHKDIIKECEKKGSAFYKLKKQKSLDVIDFISTAIRLMKGFH